MLFSIDAGKFNIAKQCGVHRRSLSRNCRISEGGIDKLGVIGQAENGVERFSNDDAGVDRLDRTESALRAFHVGAAHPNIGTQRFG